MSHTTEHAITHGQSVVHPAYPVGMKRGSLFMSWPRSARLKDSEQLKEGLSVLEC